MVALIPSVPGVSHIHVPIANFYFILCVSAMMMPVFYPSVGSISNREVGVLTDTTVPLDYPVTSTRYTYEGGDPTTCVL